MYMFSFMTQQLHWPARITTKRWAAEVDLVGCLLGFILIWLACLCQNAYGATFEYIIELYFDAFCLNKIMGFYGGLILKIV